MNADDPTSLQLDEDIEPPSPSQYNLPYSSSPVIHVSHASQHLEAAALGAEPNKVMLGCNSTNRQPGRDEETTGHEHDEDDEEDDRYEVAASKLLSKVRYVHYF